MSCVPLPVLMELGLGMLEGAAKYGRHNYRVIGVRASVYFDAACRHLFAWWEGEDLDSDSGMPHIVKAMACLAVLRDAQIQGQYTDDRPPPSPAGWIQELNDKAAAILERYPDPVPPYTAVSLNGPTIADAIAFCRDRVPVEKPHVTVAADPEQNPELARNIAYLKKLPETAIPEAPPTT